MSHLGPNFKLDLRVAMRRIRASPGISCLIVFLLALGIALNSTVFALVHALILRPLPVQNPSGLYILTQDILNLGSRSEQPFSVLEALQKHGASFAQVAGYAELDTACRTPVGPARVRAHVVTGNFFSILGTTPLLGRMLTPQDDVEGSAELPVVLSYPFWRSHFGSDPSVIGRSVTISQHSFTVVGVLREHDNGIQVETTPDLRVPLRAVLSMSTDPEENSYRKLDFIPFVRLKPGVSPAAARDEAFSLLDSTLAEETRKSGEPAYWRERPLRPDSLETGLSLLRPKLKSGLLLLMSGVAALLLIICANAGGLLLASSYARRGEIAVRLALGATGRRILAQLLTESLLLTGLGCIAGLALALFATPLLARALPPLRDLTASTLTVSLDLRPSPPVLALSMLLCLLAALLAALPAAIQSAGVDLHTALRSIRTTRRQHLRWALVVFQAALCTLLLGGAGLLTATLRNLRTLQPGFDAARIVTFTLDPSMAGYSDDQSGVLRAQLLQAVRRLPGVRAAGFSSRGLMRGTGIKTTVAPAGKRAPRSEFLNTSLNSISEGYFDALGLKLLAGRDYLPSDVNAKLPQPVVVNQVFARRFFPGEDPIGKLFGTGVEVVAKPEKRIVGVVSDAKYRSLREPVPPTLYGFSPVALKTGGSFVLHVRTHGAPEEIIGPVRSTLARLEPRLPFYEIHTLRAEVDDSLWAERVLAWLSSAFGIAAMALVLMGIYATLAFAVAQSRREVGIRIALGAQSLDILWLLSARPLLFVIAGAILGAASFLAASPFFRSLVYGLPAVNPTAITVSILLVCNASAAATWIAVRAALSTAPAAVLREE
ncbi:ADOP family duplicated permease [Paludibaculum fermentans]|uniref:ADOP family duplicated permease n=1 Tax=Paludibaculum fermentans TaxID=1473598 RepID=UPI003EB77826